MPKKWPHSQNLIDAEVNIFKEFYQKLNFEEDSRSYHKLTVLI